MKKITRRQFLQTAAAGGELVSAQPPGHPLLPRGRLELDLLFQRPMCRRHRHTALAVAGAATALNIFLSKGIDNCQRT